MKMTNNKRSILALLSMGMLLGVQGVCLAASNTVTVIAPKDTLLPGVWEENDTRTGGTAGIVELIGEGGNLENNQPLPDAAVKLTTDFTNAAKAEIGVYNDYGLAGDIIPTLQLAYDFFKATNPGQNASSSPSLKLAFYNPTCVDAASAGDCYGELVWEYYWQGAGNPALDTWTPVSLNSTTGKFWWSGGFGLPNGAGGPPLYTLAEFLAAASTDFPGADLVRVSIGVGSYNQGQIGYFDDVSITHTFGDGFDEQYDFELQGAAEIEEVPIPVLDTWSILAMFLLLGAFGIVALQRKS